MTGRGEPTCSRAEHDCPNRPPLGGRVRPACPGPRSSPSRLHRCGHRSSLPAARAHWDKLPNSESLDSSRPRTGRASIKQHEHSASTETAPAPNPTPNDTSENSSSRTFMPSHSLSPMWAVRSFSRRKPTARGDKTECSLASPTGTYRTRQRISNPAARAGPRIWTSGQREQSTGTPRTAAYWTTSRTGLDNRSGVRRPAQCRATRVRHLPAARPRSLPFVLDALPSVIESLSLLTGWGFTRMCRPARRATMRSS